MNRRGNTIKAHSKNLKKSLSNFLKRKRTPIAKALAATKPKNGLIAQESWPTALNPLTASWLKTTSRGNKASKVNAASNKISKVNKDNKATAISKANKDSNRTSKVNKASKDNAINKVNKASRGNKASKVNAASKDNNKASRDSNKASKVSRDSNKASKVSRDNKVSRVNKASKDSKVNKVNKDSRGNRDSRVNKVVGNPAEIAMVIRRDNAPQARKISKRLPAAAQSVVQASGKSVLNCANS